MAKKGVIFNENAAGRIGVAVRHFENTYRDAPKVGVKKVIRGGGGCTGRNEKWKFAMSGTPTGGSFTFNLNVKGTTSAITFNYDDTSAEIETALETHANIADGDVSVVGGPLPNVDITIEFQGDLAKMKIPEPTSINKSGLTGGTGVGVFWIGVRPGYPKDGSVAP